MLPSSSRVKLNRIVLKDVVRLQLVPRRRRKTDSMSMKSNTVLDEHEAPENVTSTRWKRDNKAETQRPERGRDHVPCGGDVRPEQEGRNTGDLGDKVTPSHCGLAASERPLRRAFKAHSCGESKFISPKMKTRGKQGAKCRGPETQQRADTQVSVWTDRYPKVMLCDVVRNSKASSHCCGYVLPKLLKTKVIHCFKRDLRSAGLCFQPYCVGHSKRGSNRCVLVQNELCPETSGCPPGNPTQHQTHLKEPACAETLSSRTQCSLLKASDNQGTAACSASFTKVKCKYNVKCRTDATDVGWDPSSQRSIAGEKRKTKSTKLRNSRKGPSVPMTSELRRTRRSNAAESPRNEDKMTCRMSTDCQSCPKPSTGTRDLSVSAAKENCNVTKSHNEDDHLSETDETWEQLCQESEVDMDEPESFTCRRVMVYTGKDCLSCARTYMAWPFTSSSRTLAEHAGTAADESSSSRIQTQQSPLSHHTDVPLTHADNRGSRRNDENLEDGAKHGRERRETEERVSDSHSWASSPSVPRRSGSETTSSPFPDSLSSVRTTPLSPTLSSLLLRDVKDDPSPSPRYTGRTLETQVLSSGRSQITSSLHPSNIPPERRGSDGEVVVFRSPPQLEPIPLFVNEHCGETDVILPPLLSPVNTPQRRTRVSPEIPGSLCRLPSPPSSGGDEAEGAQVNPTTGPGDQSSSPAGEEWEEDETKADADAQANVLDEIRAYEQDILLVGVIQEDPDLFENLSQSGPLQPGPTSVSEAPVTTRTEEPSPCGHSDHVDDGGDDQSSSPGEEECERQSEEDKIEVKADADAQANMVDEFLAYEQDVLLVHVIQENPELFDNLPHKSLLKLGPTRGGTAPIPPRTEGAPGQKQASVKMFSLCDSPEDTDECVSRPWRPQSSSGPSSLDSSTCSTPEGHTSTMGPFDANNNHLQQRSQPVPPVNSAQNHIPVVKSTRVTTDFRHQRPSSLLSEPYCWLYFSDSSKSCGLQMCRFKHVPVEGDEKFCVDTVTWFIKQPGCLQKAGAVYTGYYQNNPPGGCFSLPVFLSLLWALLKASMVPDVLSVLSVSLAHKIVPSYDFLLALFKFVREKGFAGFVSELVLLTFKMVGAGLMLSQDCFDCIKNTPVFHSNFLSVSGSHKLSGSTGGSLPDCFHLASILVEIELCTKQEDWKQMGEVFRSLCRSSQHHAHMERISGHIAVALLSESKDKLTLPFAAFADTFCHSADENVLSRSFIGRIGVSLMLRFYKTHQWMKGRRVVEVLSVLKVNYSMLKGLFGNEDRASRCFLVTVATELFLLSGSVEGALNTLRENQWFVSSCSWPCELVDLERRSHLLMGLVEKTSQRDTLEVLRNLPGLKEPNDSVDVSKYICVFNTHLRVCMDRQMLPVAADTSSFMLSKHLPVDKSLLQALLHKLGKQNIWVRAREIFKHSLSAGYYPGVSVQSGFMTLIVTCQLGEVELALTFEMFITVNATAIFHLSDTSPSCLTITLKRTQASESEYLSAGSRLLSAACIPQPKLSVHYMAVNSFQEQVFALDVTSARQWLFHNRLWANEVWTR